MNATKSRTQTLTTIILILCILLILVFIVYMARVLFADAAIVEPEPAPTPADQPVPETEPPAEPEPVETRQYVICSTPTGNAFVDAAVDGMIAKATESFNADFDVSSGKQLDVYIENSMLDSCCSTLVTIHRPDRSTVETHTYSLADGHEMSGDEVFGEGYREYLRDYFEENLPVMESIRGLLTADYGACVTNDPANFNSFIVKSDGSADFWFLPGTVITTEDYAMFNVGSNVLSGEYYNRRRVDPAKPMVCLTFDDGPHGTYTPQILDILEEYGVVATFFEVGQNVAEYPEIVKRAYDLGCEIGSHTYVHRNLAKSGEEQLRSDKEQCDEAFTNAIGCVPRLIRPPEGAMSISAKNYYDQIFIGWSVDTLDWYTKNTWSTVDCVESFGNLDGQVVLMHSLYSPSVEAVRELVPWLLEQGYQLVTVSEMFEYGYGITPESHVYYAYDYFIHGRPVREPAA